MSEMYTPGELSVEEEYGAENLKAGSVSIINKLHDDAAKRVLAQRDELLAALNLLKAADFGANVKTAEDERHMDSVAAFARAAIAKVEGGA